MSLESLSPAQKQVYDLAQQGLTVAAISQKLGITEGVAAAQITRIRNKGIQLPGQESRPGPQFAGYESRPASEKRPAPSDPVQIVKEAERTGEAQYPDLGSPLMQEAAAKVGQGIDVHPMILLGVTIQFVKLVGGRMTAHQVIEDVYEALRMMVGEGGLPDDGATSPWPKDLEAENAALKDQMIALKQEVSDLRRHLERSRSPEPSTVS